MQHTPFTPEEEKRIKQILAEEKKRDGVMGWLLSLFPQNPLLITAVMGLFLLGHLDDAYNYCKDAKERLPIVINGGEYVGSYALDRLEHGIKWPVSPDGTPLLAISYSSGSYTIGSTVNVMTPAGRYAGITGGPLLSSGDTGTIEVTKMKKSA